MIRDFHGPELDDSGKCPICGMALGLILSLVVICAVAWVVL